MGHDQEPGRAVAALPQELGEDLVDVRELVARDREERLAPLPHEDDGSRHREPSESHGRRGPAFARSGTHEVSPALPSGGPLTVTVPRLSERESSVRSTADVRRATTRLLRNLSPMPYADDPDGISCDAVEEAVRGHDDFTVGKLGELREDATRLGEPLQPVQRTFGALPEPSGSAQDHHAGCTRPRQGTASDRQA